MRDASPGRNWSATMVLVVGLTVIYFFQLLSGLASSQRGSFVFSYLALDANKPLRWIYQLFTFQVLHGGTLHLLLNLLAIYVFGRPVEAAMGSKRFLFLFFGSGIAGGLLQAGLMHTFDKHFNPSIPVVGASAGCYALIAAWTVFNWHGSITTLVMFILPITLPAKVLLLISAVLAIFGLLEKDSGTAHAAHLGGLIAGFIYARWGMDWHLHLPSARALRDLARPKPKITVMAAPAWKTEPANTKPTATENPPGDFMSQEVDPILDKISAHGIQSLTEHERRVLELARSRMAKR